MQGANLLIKNVILRYWRAGKQQGNAEGSVGTEVGLNELPVSISSRQILRHKGSG